MSPARQIIGFVGWLALAFIAAALGAIASSHAAGFYEQLQRPAWAPPAALFGPVWSVLYILMGIASWMVWRERGFRGASKRALGLYLLQLAANALWSWLFFAWHRGAWAFGEIIVLWLLITATTLAFSRIRPTAALLLLPYLAWVSFATALAFTTWRLNPELLS